MQTTDKATAKQHTQWQDSKGQHSLTGALDKKRDDTDKIRTVNMLAVNLKHKIHETKCTC